MQQQKPLMKLLFNYTHQSGSNLEQFRRTEIISENLPLKDENVHTMQKEYPLGHMLSKLMKLVSAMNRTPPSSDIGVEQMESIITDLRQRCFQTEEDALLLDLFLVDFLWAIYLMQGYLPWILMENINSFLELCCEESKYCTIDNLAVITSEAMIPLSAGERLIHARSAKEPNRKLLTAQEMKNLLEEEKRPAFCSHNIQNLAQIALASLFEIFSEGHIIKKCPNCNSFFVPLTRSDTIYCDEPAPQDLTKSCKEYGKYVAYLKKTQMDLATKLYKQIYNLKANRVKRCDNSKLKEELESFIAEARAWKTDIKAGTREESDFIQWMKDVKER